MKEIPKTSAYFFNSGSVIELEMRRKIGYINRRTITQARIPLSPTKKARLPYFGQNPKRIRQ